jgi:hypothetical protein
MKDAGFHAYGAGQGLTEYSLATEDAQAIADFAQVFAVEWARASLRP